MSDLVERARLFAMASHEDIGQRRKYTGEPYIVHPAAVVEIVKSVAHTDEMLAAAWLHDVVEDCGVTLKEIEDRFGNEVASLVYWLTDLSRPENGNRQTRKAMDRQRLSEAPDIAQTIKLADIIENTRTIGERDPSFAQSYIREKRLLIAILTRGDPELIKIGQQTLARAGGM